MQTRYLNIVVLALFLALTSHAQAQFGGLRNMLKKVEDVASGDNPLSDLTSAAVGGGETSGTGTTMVTSFVTSYGHVLDAQIEFSRAFGLEDQAEQLEIEKSVLTSGQIDRDSLQKIRVTSGNVQLLIDAKTAENFQLSEIGRNHYEQGLIYYFLGVAEAYSLVQSAKAMDFSAESLLANFGDTTVSMYVVTEAPGYLQRLGSTGGMLMQFGRENDLDLPEDATGLLDLI